MKLSDLLINAMRDHDAQFRVSLPARVEKYDKDKQNVSVQPLIKRKFREGGEQSMPVLQDVPLIFPRAGGAFLTMPVKQGDGVLLVFADRSLDKWLAKGGEVAPEDPRMHDVSDAVAIPGLYSFQDFPQAAANNDDVQLHFNGADILVKADGSIVLTTGNTTATLDGSSIELNGSTLDITTSGNTTINPALLTINSDVIINGKLTVSGEIEANGDISSQGLTFNNHVHGDVEPGNAETSEPRQP